MPAPATTAAPAPITAQQLAAKSNGASANANSIATMMAPVKKTMAPAAMTTTMQKTIA